LFRFFSAGLGAIFGSCNNMDVVLKLAERKRNKLFYFKVKATI
jgi:hypothetical protein